MQHSVTWHRKISFAFRDTTLYQIFEIACQLLKDTYNNAKNVDFNDSTQVRIYSACMSCIVSECSDSNFAGVTASVTA